MKGRERKNRKADKGRSRHKGNDGHFEKEVGPIFQKPQFLLVKQKKKILDSVTVCEGGHQESGDQMPSKVSSHHLLQ